MQQHRNIDIEALADKYNRLAKRTFDKPTKDEAYSLIPFFETLLSTPSLDEKVIKTLKITYKIPNKKNSFMIQASHILFNDGMLTKEQNQCVRQILRIKNGKSLSGVVVVTVFTSGEPEYTDPKTGEKKKHAFSCAWNCSFCPNEPGQPRSYLKLETGVMRANRNNFDCVSQIHDRLTCLYDIGHDIDKLEILVSGGTFSSYPVSYREEFVRDIFYAANTFQDEQRSRMTLEEEKKINKFARVKVIGITIETRPDCIVPEELRRFRKWEITRVQIGLQHLDQDVLDKNNRQCMVFRMKRAIQMLKDCCFKIDIHIMLNMPFSSIEKDTNMLLNGFCGLKSKPMMSYVKRTWWDFFTGQKEIPERIEEWKLLEEDIVGDQWKLYPTMVTPWTEIEKWYKEGLYVPYSEKLLRNLLETTMERVFPFIRVNRVIRDFPEGDYDITGSNIGSMRNDIIYKLNASGKQCMEIRSREPKDSSWNGKYILVIRKYRASNGIEYFISGESFDGKTIYGFIRVRIPCDKINIVFQELSFCGLIRELHVYGRVEIVKGDNNKKSNVQHRGLGKVLLGKAEEIIKANHYYKSAVIAGAGVKGYYEKHGYIETGNYMTKCLLSL